MQACDCLWARQILHQNINETLSVSASSCLIVCLYPYTTTQQQQRQQPPLTAMLSARAS